VIGTCLAGADTEVTQAYLAPTHEKGPKMPPKPPGKVPNKYKAAVARNYGQAGAVARELANIMNDATSAMNGKAWVSTRADAFAGELKGVESTLRSAGSGCEAALKAKRDSEPDMVDPDSWQAKWLI